MVACVLNCSVPVPEANVESRRRCEACTAMTHGSRSWCEDSVWWHDDPIPCPSYPDSPGAEGDEGRDGKEERPFDRSSAMPAWPIVATESVTVLRASI